MDLSLNDTQQLIQDSARDFVRGACGRDVLLKLDRNPAAIMDGSGADVGARLDRDGDSGSVRRHRQLD